MLRSRDRHAGQRCPICGNADWADHSGDDECTHCRLIVRAEADLRTVAIDVERRLAAGMIDLKREPAADWTLDSAGLRNVAWRFGLVLTAIDADQVGFPADYRPVRALARPATPRPHDVTLAIMTAEHAVAEALTLLHAVSASFVKFAVLVDGSEAAARTIAAARPDAVVAVHPLNGDFGDQRNRLQDMTDGGWVLQLDTDERPDDTLLASLGWLTVEADRDGVRSLGLARRKIVDGAQSALFPDIQYRLNKADIRFAGAVHERPVTTFEQTSLALCGALDHYLDSRRVRARTGLYEAMSAGGGRPEDEALLLRPFDPIAIR